MNRQDLFPSWIPYEVDGWVICGINTNPEEEFTALYYVNTTRRHRLRIDMTDEAADEKNREVICEVVTDFIKKAAFELDFPQPDGRSTVIH